MTASSPEPPTQTRSRRAPTIRPPSFGLIYLVITLIGVFAFFRYLNQPFFFELPPRKAPFELGEARYLLKAAAGEPQDVQTRFLSDALALATKHDDQDLIRQIEAALGKPEKTPDSPEFVEVKPGVWLANFDSAGWTTRATPGIVRLHNPTDANLRIRLKFRSTNVASGAFTIGANAGKFTLDGENPNRAGNFLTPLIAPRETILIEVAIDGGGGEDREAPGLQFDGAELVQ